MSSLNNMRNRNGYWGVVKRTDAYGNEVTNEKGKYKKITQVHDQWTRMREDKLRSLKRALYYSYQAAIVQKYDVNIESETRWLISLATKIEKYATLDAAGKSALAAEVATAEEKYSILICDKKTKHMNIYAKLLSFMPAF